MLMAAMLRMAKSRVGNKPPGVCTGHGGPLALGTLYKYSSVLGNRHWPKVSTLCKVLSLKLISKTLSKIVKTLLYFTLILILTLKT